MRQGGSLSFTKARVYERLCSCTGGLSEMVRSVRILTGNSVAYDTCSRFNSRNN